MHPSHQERLHSQKLPAKAMVAGRIIALIVRAIGLTLRWRVSDPQGLVKNYPEGGMIWVLWHNRTFALPLLYKKFLPRVRGVVLTSASRDGNYLAAVARAVGVCAVRGSSSRRGASALIALTDWLADGYTVGITPDGPRGPRYRFAPGAIKLSQVSGAPIVALRIDFSSAWVFRGSWDHFRLPKPFSTVELTWIPCDPVAPDLTEEAFESERLRVEGLLKPSHETD